MRYSPIEVTPSQDVPSRQPMTEQKPDFSPSSSLDPLSPTETERQIESLIKAMQSRVVPQVAERVNPLSPAERSQILTPALAWLAERDPSTAQWFIRYLITDEARAQLRQGIHAAAREYLQQSGFVEGQDFWRQDQVLILSRAALPYAAPDDDPWGQLLVAEFCQLQ